MQQLFLEEAELHSNFFAPLRLKMVRTFFVRAYHSKKIWCQGTQKNAQIRGNKWYLVVLFS